MAPGDWEILKNAPESFACFQVLPGKEGEPVDLTILKANPAFGKKVGLVNKDLSGKKLSELFPPKMVDEWLKHLSREKNYGAEIRFEISPGFFSGVFEVTAWSNEDGTINTLLKDISHYLREKEVLEELLKVNREMKKLPEKVFDFKLLTRRLRNYTGAEIVLLALLDRDGARLTIDAFAGSPEVRMEKIEERISSSSWTCSQQKIVVEKTNRLFFYDSIQYLLAYTSLEEIISWFVPDFKLGKAGVIEVDLPGNGRASFILLMPPGELKVPGEMIELFTNQLALMLKKVAIVESIPEKYHLIFQNAPIGILHFNHQGIITACNDKFVEVIGSSREALLGLNMLKLPDSRITAAVEKVLQGEIGRFEGDYTSVTAEKTTPVRVLFAPVVSGGFGGGIGIIEDISEIVQTQKVLKYREGILQTIYNTAPIGIGLSVNRVIRECNEQFGTMLGYSREELLHQSTRMLFVDREEYDRFGREKRKQVRKKGSYTLETTFLRKDGSLIDVLLQASLYQPEKPEEGFIFTVMDISETREKERELKDAYSILEAMFQNSPNPVTICSKDRYVFVSPATAELLGLPVEQLQGKEFKEVLSEGVEQQFKDNLSRVEQEEGSSRIMEKIPTTRGDRFYETWIFPVLDPLNGKKLFGVLSIDITARKKHEEKLNYMSYHDVLTGLKNRTYLEEKLEMYSQNEELPLCVIMADINGLKLVNDGYGHKMGDRILVKVARILEEGCPQNAIISRWGGDEFVIILPGADRTEAEQVGRNLQEGCQQVYVNNLPVSISWGAGERVSAEQDMEQILQEAENQMDRNKLTESSSGRSAILSAMLGTLGVRSCETEEHALRLKKLAWQVGEKIKLPLAEQERLSLLVSLHDIGKISISPEILNKPGLLSAEEWEQIKKHPETGFHIAHSTGEFGHIGQEILAHHERWDGKGYPRGLNGIDIPLLSRILAIVDAYDVMINGRPYKKPMSRDEAIAELQRCSGTQFDLELVEIFLQIIKEEE